VGASPPTRRARQGPASPGRSRRSGLAARLDLLEQVAPAIVQSLDADEIVSTVAEQTLRVIDYDHFRLYRFDTAGQCLRLVKSVARTDPYTRVDWQRAGVRIPLGEGIAGIAARERQTVLVPDASRDPRVLYLPGSERLAEAVLAVPMVAGDRLVGVLALARRKAASLSPNDARLMEAIAAQTALALVNADRYAEAEQTMRDERERAAILADLERNRREFMQIASHELRTPLTVIRGYASLLEEGSLGELPERAQAAVRMIIDKSAEMRAQVERVLFLARLEEGRPVYQMRPVDLARLVDDAVVRFSPQLDLARGTVARTASADSSIVVVGDPDRLSLVLDNVLQNAARFTLEPPRIEIEVRALDGQAELRIRDHGIGIPQEAMARLFDKFYRVEDRRLRNVSGTGIGLYLVRQVVLDHGGTIEVDGDARPGTAIQIRLPLLPVEAAPAAPAQAAVS
jgi:signal transduction histidine kinase